MNVPEKFYEIIKHEGVATIGTLADGELHLSNTWNSYLEVTDSGKLIYPAGGMKVTEANVAKNNHIQMTVGSREVDGFNGPGTGFRINGTAAFLTAGPYYEKIKQQFPWARAAVEITIDSINQTL